MRLLLLLPVVLGSSVLDVFQRNGIVYEEFGQGRLIREEQYCRPWTMDLFNYVNGLHTDKMTENGRILLKRRLYQSFASICSGFETPTGTTEIPPSFNESIEKSSIRYMDQYELGWNVQKFERDMKSLFLEHKLVTPFQNLVTENERRLFVVNSGEEFAEKTTIFPTECKVAELQLETRVCRNTSEPTMTGVVYAIAHAGQFVNDDQAYVYYDIPSFVMVDQNNLTVIDINKCKIMFGAFIYCFSTEMNPCDLMTMQGCQLFAVSGGNDNIFMRTFGSGKLVATTADVIDAADNGNLEPTPSQVFSLNLSYILNEDGVTVEQAKMTPFEFTAQKSFPLISGDSLSLLKEQPIPVYQVQRKGAVYLTHKKPSPTVWDDVKDFLLFW